MNGQSEKNAHYHGSWPSFLTTRDAKWRCLPIVALAATMFVATHIPARRQEAFAWSNAGTWDIQGKTVTIMIHMRESGSVFDLLRLRRSSDMAASLRARYVHPDSCRRATASATHRWTCVELTSSWTLDSLWMPHRSQRYVQAVANSGIDDDEANESPRLPLVAYSAEVDTSGLYSLDIHMLNGPPSSDSIWVNVIGGRLVNLGNCRSVVDGSVLVDAGNRKSRTKWDMAWHAGMYALLSAMTFRVAVLLQLNSFAVASLALGICIYGAVDEITQVAVGRKMSLSDWGCDVGGVLFAWYLVQRPRLTDLRMKRAPS